MIGIYQITNKVNGKIYIGKSINIKHRINSHKCSQPRNKRTPITNAIYKYGWENFRVDIIESFDDISNDALLIKESEWINKKDATNKKIGYNICLKSNDFSGIHRSEETKKKISLAVSGEKNPYFRKRHTKEAKKLMSIAWEKRLKSGWIPTPRTVNSEGRRKMSEAKRGFYLGSQNPYFGKSHSEESKIKMKEKAKLRNFSYSKAAKPIKQIDLNTGLIIKIWESAKKAGESLANSHSSITQCCKNKRISALGFGWEYV